MKTLRTKGWPLGRYGILSAVIVMIVVIVAAAFLGSRGTAAIAALPACPAAFPGGEARCVPLGFATRGLVGDDTIGRVLAYNTWSPSATTIDINTAAVLRTVQLGAKEDYVFTAVDRRTHRFFVSLPRGKYSTGAGNQVYMLDARSGAVLRRLSGVAQPAEVAVDEARGHAFVADTLKSSVLMYDTRSGALLRAVPSCRDTEALALSAATGHLFVRCINGVLLMHDAASGKILHEEFTPTSRMDNDWRSNSGVDTGMDINDGTHRLVISDLASGASRLYDLETGHLLRVLPLNGFFANNTTHGSFLFVPQPRNISDHRIPPRLSVLDGQTGAVQYTLKVPGGSIGGGQENPRTGHLVVISDGPFTPAGAPAGPGVLTVLDARSGKVLRSLTMGVLPIDMFVDAQANRLTVLSQGWGDSTPGSLTILKLSQL